MGTWPAIARFNNSDELEVIEDDESLQEYASSIHGEFELIFSDGTVSSISSDTHGLTITADSGSKITVENAVILAQKHMAAQSHCCVSKFNASTVEEVIATIAMLDQE